MYAELMTERLHLRRWRPSDAEDYRMLWSERDHRAVRRIDAGEFVGYCGLTVGQATYDEPEIAYELAQRTHGHGYATEAARAVVEAAARTGRNRLWATVRVWNTASFRVLEKLGFENSGRVDPNPERGDSIWMTRDLGQPLA